MLFISTVLLFLSAIYCLYRYVTKNHDFWKNKGIKYVEPVPFFGNMLPVVMKKLNTRDLIKSLYDAHPDERYCGVYQFMTPVLLIKDAELVKQISIKHFDSFVDHAGILSENDPYWSANLFSVKGERWRDLRHTMSPVFTSSKMRNMFPLMEECIKDFMERCRNKAVNESIVEIEMQEMAKRITMDVIATTAFGIKCKAIEDPNDEFLKHGSEILHLTGIRRLTFLIGNNFPALAKLLNWRLVSETNGNYFQSIIDEVIKLRADNKVIRPDLIHLLMMARQTKQKFTDPNEAKEITEFPTVTGSDQFLSNKDIAAQAIVFIVGGYDTLSYLLSFTAYELAINPEVQNKLREEIQSTWTENELTYSLVKNMKYLDMVISESLRKWSQGVFIDRVCTSSFEIAPIKDGEIPLTLNVGDMVWFSINAIANDPKYFPDPSRFDPERFNEENRSKIPDCAYNPFGAGPRSCLGSRYALLEAKVFICHLLKEFELVPVAKTQVPLKLSRDTAFLEPENGLHLGLKKLVN